jgi:hypothetical protein
LKQEVEPGDWKVVQAGSRFLSEAETRYATMELEMLAIAWAYKKCSNFIKGSKFQILTDHKPLIPMLRDYSLNDFENKRLQRLILKINHLNFEVDWVP